MKQNNPFKDVVVVESQGRLFKLHWQRKYDPVTITAVTLMAAGTTISMANTIQEGKDTQKIANANAAIEMENAKAARNSAVEKAKITAERGRRLLAEQKGAIAASGIKLNVGSPLVIESQTKDDISRDVGFILEQGRAQEDYHKSSATVQRAYGKSAKRQSKWAAVGQGLQGFGSIAFMGANAGWFSKTPAGSVPGAGSTGMNLSSSKPSFGTQRIWSTP